MPTDVSVSPPGSTGYAELGVATRRADACNPRRDRRRIVLTHFASPQRLPRIQFNFACRPTASSRRLEEARGPSAWAATSTSAASPLLLVSAASSTATANGEVPSLLLATLHVDHRDVANS
ncbi:hypothetical protein K466DRAFT_580743, partial [Polyporus arcularius HHB13444]